MTAERLHIKTEFNSTVQNKNIVAWYALDQETLRKAQLWLGHQQKTPTTEEFANWLHNNGGLLDHADGPAYIEIWPYTTRREEWRSNGQLDREDGPAVIQTYADGSRREEWYSKDLLDRTDGPAVIHTFAESTRLEEWYSQGQLDHTDGPAFIEIRPDGSRYERWYSKGEFVKDETLPSLSAIPGVTLHPPPAP